MLHDETLHYLDNAATTRVDPAVADAIRAAMTDLWANPSALYTPGLQAQQALGKARAQVAKTLGCTPGEVYFTACGSESNNLALRGAAIARKGWGRKIRLKIKYFSFFAFCLVLAKISRCNKFSCSSSFWENVAYLF